MKEVTSYICEYCGAKYSNKNNAEKCELSHVAPKRILSADYTTNHLAEFNYPMCIVVEMSDGDTIAYKCK